MTEQLVLLVIGFLLTSVLGGLLATYLQQRAWRHQNDARLAEDNLRRAGDVCKTVSLLLDKRLYRMLRLFYALRAASTAAFSRELLELRLEDYNEVLYEWNDHLNLALVGTYFGETARDWLEVELYQSYQRAGIMLEQSYAALPAQSVTILAKAESELLALNDSVYRLGVFMMTKLRSGAIGAKAPSPLGSTNRPKDEQGRAVPCSRAFERLRDSLRRRQWLLLCLARRWDSWRPAKMPRTRGYGHLVMQKVVVRRSRLTLD